MIPDQIELLRETDWDVLVVLDALRWDIWDEMVGDGEPVWSPGNCTPEWIRAVQRELDFSDVHCVAANPEVTRNTHESLYYDRDDIWRTEWEEVNGIGTVRPSKVTSFTSAALTIGPEKPVYAHYAQPHGPYPDHDPPVPVMRNNPHASEVNTDIGGHPDQIIMDPTSLLNDPDSWLDVETLRSAYRSNLQFALDSVQTLLDGPETVVITADHGEILGEQVGDIRYGHPPGDPIGILRKVPFAIYD
jgi:hypothetical protein